MDNVKEYTRDELTVVWKQDLCIHSAKCATGLKGVFDPQKRPWINMDGAEKAAIIDQVKKCPSGALSIRVAGESTSVPTTSDVTVQVNPTGPLIVTGDFTITHADGRQEVRNGRTTLCRCGASANKPFCDASHKKIEFKG